MTQEEKNLLIKELGARLPHKVIVEIISYTDETSKPWFGELSCKDLDCFIHDVAYKSIKPYLRPVSSMTDEEMDQLFDILRIDKDGNDEDWIKINDVLGIKFFFPTGKWVENVAEAYDYLNSIHIDYRGLIAKGLALEAPEGMYK